MSLKALYNLEEQLCEELSTWGNKKELSPQNLEQIDKLAHACKNVGKVIERKEEMESGYSQDGDWEARGSYGRGDSYSRGNSYARRRRDSMGRYSRTGYSRMDSPESMASNLREMMDNESLAPHQRTAIKQAMDALNGY